MYDCAGGVTLQALVFQSATNINLTEPAWVGLERQPHLAIILDDDIDHNSRIQPARLYVTSVIGGNWCIRRVGDWRGFWIGSKVTLNLPFDDVITLKFFLSIFSIDMIRRSFLKKHSSSNVMMKVLKPKALKYGLGTPYISVECYSNCIPRI